MSLGALTPTNERYILRTSMHLVCIMLQASTIRELSACSIAIRPIRLIDAPTSACWYISLTSCVVGSCEVSTRMRRSPLELV